jgi:hypothetical protein
MNKNEKPKILSGKQEMVEDQNTERDIILDRIAKEAGVPKIFDVLMKIPNTDLQSLLLELMDKKAFNAGAKEINSILENNPFVEMSKVDQLTFVKFDSLAYNLLPPEYRSVELPPLVPFATNKVLAGISQKRVLSTMRNSEVISDPTTALALYCAKERADKIRKFSKDSELVAMATSQRAVRQDPVKKEEYSQHFRTFTIGVAGRDVGFEKFEKENLKKHLGFFLSLMEKLNESGDYVIDEITVTLSDVDKKQPELLSMIKDTVVKELSEAFPRVIFKFDLDRKSDYYKNLCYGISAKNKNGELVSVAGGGMTDWTEILVESKKEKLLVGSIGSETLCRHFKS